MNRLIDGTCRAVEALMALMLAAMVVLIFGNVVLRYGFNSGILVSEELSRWLFIWITFLGAIVALRERAHLGVDLVVARLPLWGKKVCMALTHVLMIYILWLLFNGSMAQVKINWEVEAPVTGAPVAIVYSAALLFSVCAAFLLALDLLRLLTGQVSNNELVSIKESEDLAAVEETLALHEEESKKDKGRQP